MGGIAAFAVAGGVVPLGVVATTLIGAPGAVGLRLLRQVVARRAIDRALIEAERAKLPQRVFEQEYGAQFCEGAGAVVLRRLKKGSEGGCAGQFDDEDFYDYVEEAIEETSVLRSADDDDLLAAWRKPP